MRTYLVTGGAGFIGSNYIHYMFRKYDNEIRIINVDVLTYAGNLENLKDIENRDNYTFVKADITDKEAITKIFEENDIDRVVHFAAESHVDCQTAHCGRRKPYFDFGVITSPIVPYRNLPQTPSGMTADCRSLV